MIRPIIVFFALLISIAHASPVENRVKASLREASTLPDRATIDIVRMTTVRGNVDRVDIVDFEPKGGRFTAIIGHGQSEAMIVGRARILVPVVVPTSTLRRDHMINMDDVQVRRVPWAQAPKNAYSAVEDVVGKSVRRSLASGRAIASEDIGSAIVVRKNAAVAIVYRKPGMAMVTQGQALEDGAMGDNVRVSSDGQGRVVLGKVVSPDQVLVK